MCVALPATPCPLLVSKTCKRRKNDQHCPMEHRRQRKCIYIWVKERRRVLEKWTPFDTELNPISIQQHGRRGAGHSILVIQLRGPMGVVLGKSWRVIGEEEMRRRQRRRKITTFFSRGPGSSILIGLDFHSRDFWQRAVFLWKKYAKNKCLIHLARKKNSSVYRYIWPEACTCSTYTLAPHTLIDTHTLYPLVHCMHARAWLDDSPHLQLQACHHYAVQTASTRITFLRFWSIFYSSLHYVYPLLIHFQVWTHTHWAGRRFPIDRAQIPIQKYWTIQPSIIGGTKYRNNVSTVCT
jgi:hypothetical protein